MNTWGLQEDHCTIITSKANAESCTPTQNPFLNAIADFKLFENPFRASKTTSRTHKSGTGEGYPPQLIVGKLESKSLSEG